MDDQLTEKIRALLADPQAVERIAAIAGSLGASSGGETPPQPDPTPVQRPPALPQPGPDHRQDPRLDLLRALRPLVSEEKRGRLDDLVRIATVASLLGTIQK